MGMGTRLVVAALLALLLCSVPALAQDVDAVDGVDDLMDAALEADAEAAVVPSTVETTTIDTAEAPATTEAPATSASAAVVVVVPPQTNALTTSRSTAARPTTKPSAMAKDKCAVVPRRALRKLRDCTSPQDCKAKMQLAVDALMLPLPSVPTSNLASPAVVARAIAEVEKRWRAAQAADNAPQNEQQAIYNRFIDADHTYVVLPESAGTVLRRATGQSNALDAKLVLAYVWSGALLRSLKCKPDSPCHVEQRRRLSQIRLSMSFLLTQRPRNMPLFREDTFHVVCMRDCLKQCIRNVELFAGPRVFSKYRRLAQDAQAAAAKSGQQRGQRSATAKLVASFEKELDNFRKLEPKNMVEWLTEFQRRKYAECELNTDCLDTAGWAGNVDNDRDFLVLRNILAGQPEWNKAVESLRVPRADFVYARFAWSRPSSYIIGLVLYPLLAVACIAALLLGRMWQDLRRKYQLALVWFFIVACVAVRLTFYIGAALFARRFSSELSGSSDLMMQNIADWLLPQLVTAAIMLFLYKWLDAVLSEFAPGDRASTIVRVTKYGMFAFSGVMVAFALGSGIAVLVGADNAMPVATIFACALWTCIVLFNAALLAVTLYTFVRLQREASKRAVLIRAVLRMSVILSLMLVCLTGRCVYAWIVTFSSHIIISYYYVGAFTEVIPLTCMLFFVLSSYMSARKAASMEKDRHVSGSFAKPLLTADEDSENSGSSGTNNDAVESPYDY